MEIWALVGFPFFSGYYSKDLIIESALKNQSVVNFFCSFLAIAAAGFTAYYSAKALLSVFIMAPRGNPVVFYVAKDPGFFMSLPLFILALFSLFFGELSQDLFLSYDFYKGSLASLKVQNAFLLEDFLHFSQKDYVLIVSLAGILLAYFLSFYGSSTSFYKMRKILLLFYKRLWFDAFYYKLFVVTVLRFAMKGPYQSMDKGLFEFLGFTGIIRFVVRLIQALRVLQSGYIFNYAFLIVIGLIVIFFILK